MNPVSIDIKDILVDAGFGTFVTDIFIGKEPTTPANTITIYDTPSFAPDLNFDAEERYYTSSFQIQVRNTSYEDGMTLMRNILESLHGRAHEPWNGTLYTVIQATGEPALLDWDGNDRPRFVLNFNAQRRDV